MYLSSGVLSRHPCFKIVFLRCNRADVARADVNNAIGQTQLLYKILSVMDQLFMQFPRVLRLAENELFNLVKLMSAEHSTCVFAMRTCFLSEIGAKPSTFHC